MSSTPPLAVGHDKPGASSAAAQNPLAKALAPLSHATALAAGYALLLLSLMIVAEILLRRFAGISLQSSDEIGGYVLTFIGAFGFSLALLERAHTRVDILIERLPAGLSAICNAIACLATAGMASFMAWGGWGALNESIEYQSLSGTPLMTPLWMPQSIWVAGLFFFAALSLAVSLHALLLLVRNRARLNRYYGLKTLEEIIDEEQVDSSMHKPEASQ